MSSSYFFGTYSFTSLRLKKACTFINKICSMEKEMTYKNISTVLTIILFLNSDQNKNCDT